MPYLIGLGLSKEVWVAVLLLVGVVGYQGWKHKWINFGEQKHAAKVEKADNEAVEITGSAAAKSGDPASRGVRDPYAVK